MRKFRITKSITNRESHVLKLYLQEIFKIPKITIEEEIQLAQKIKKGDRSALDKLVKANLSFVVSVAKRYQYKGLNLLDLINEGNLGLIKAAERFDETKGFKFISYAVWWIRQSITSSLDENSRVIHLPLNKVGNLNKVKKAFSLLEQSLCRNPTMEEIADFMDVSVEDIKNLSFLPKFLSTDSCQGDDEDGPTFLDSYKKEVFPNPEKIFDKPSFKFDLSRTLDTLSENESKVIFMYFGIDSSKMKLEEIGEVIGLTRERVRQIKESALGKLKKSQRNKLLQNYYFE